MIASYICEKQEHVSSIAAMTMHATHNFFVQIIGLNYLYRVCTKFRKDCFGLFIYFFSWIDKRLLNALRFYFPKIYWCGYWKREFESKCVCNWLLLRFVLSVTETKNVDTSIMHLMTIVFFYFLFHNYHVAIEMIYLVKLRYIVQSILVSVFILLFIFIFII